MDNWHWTVRTKWWAIGWGCIPPMFWRKLLPHCWSSEGFDLATPWASLRKPKRQTLPK